MRSLRNVYRPKEICSQFVKILRILAIFRCKPFPWKVNIASSNQKLTHDLAPKRFVHRAFEAPTLPALVLKIMRGNYRPVPAHYSKTLADFVGELLSVDPNRRPGLAQIMAHPWLAPTIYSLPTTLGVLPCTAKASKALFGDEIPSRLVRRLECVHTVFAEERPRVLIQRQDHQLSADLAHQC